MEIGEWLSQNWFSLLQSAGIIASLLFTGISLRVDSKVRRVNNLITLTQQHRDIWAEIFKRPELSRVFDPEPDLENQPLTPMEELLVTLLVLHLSSTHQAMQDQFFVAPDGLEKDIATFFSYPIPAAVWEKIRDIQNKDFVKFVECLRNVR